MPTPNPWVFGWWVIVVAVAGLYWGAALAVWWRMQDIVALLYAIAFGSVTVMAGVNVAVRGGANVDPYLLVAIQRGMYAPLLVSLAALLDVYLAEHNGRLSVIRRMVRWWEYVIPNRGCDDGT